MRLLPRPRSLVCQEMVELVTEYLEGTMTRAERRRFERHLDGCPDCTRYLEQMRVTLEAVGHLHAADVSPEAERELLAAFRGWREADGST